jgi:hypothetical protein
MIGERQQGNIVIVRLDLRKEKMEAKSTTEAAPARKEVTQISDVRREKVRQVLIRQLAKAGLD